MREGGRDGENVYIYMHTYIYTYIYIYICIYMYMYTQAHTHTHTHTHTLYVDQSAMMREKARTSIRRSECDGEGDGGMIKRDKLREYL